MTTEYYQIPSQQGLLPALDESADPWLAAATSVLSLADWTVSKTTKQAINPPSLFEPEDVESSVSWKTMVPLQYSNTKQEVRAPVAPRQFNPTTSKVDAWSVVDTTNNLKQQKNKIVKAQPTKTTPPTTPKQVKAAPKEEKPIEDELSGQNRYKTELCKSFGDTGACRYGVKCQFAHGKEEIRGVLRHPKYKTEICKTFHTTGTCPYGIRCRFIHTRSKEAVVVVVKQEEEDVDDDEVAASAPEWSKSWTMSMAAVAPSKVARHVVAAPEPAF